SLQIRGGLLSVGNPFSFPTFNFTEPSQVDSLSLSGVLNGGGDLTIARSFLFNFGTLSGIGGTYIAPEATMELRGGTLDGRPITVAGTLRGTGPVQFRRSPILEIQQGGTFEAANNFTLTTTNWEFWQTGNGEIGQINVFGRFVTEPDAFARVGLQVNV